MSESARADEQGADSVSLSAEVSDPEARIAALRKAFQAGTYQVSSDELASRIVDEHTAIRDDES